MESILIKKYAKRFEKIYYCFYLFRIQNVSLTDCKRNHPSALQFVIREKNEQITAILQIKAQKKLPGGPYNNARKCKNRKRKK
jgi:hypothetical protein